MSDMAQPAFRALADPTRRTILRMLGERDMTIAEVADQFDMTRAAVKKHLSVLQKGQLVVVSARGRERVNSLRPDGIRPVTDWLSYFDRFWDGHLEYLKITIENKGMKE